MNLNHATRHRPPRKPFLRMWGAPIGLSLLTMIGLIAALLGDGVWDYVSAVALGVPTIACAWYGLRR